MIRPNTTEPGLQQESFNSFVSGLEPASTLGCDLGHTFHVGIAPGQLDTKADGRGHDRAKETRSQAQRNRTAEGVPDSDDFFAVRTGRGDLSCHCPNGVVVARGGSAMARQFGVDDLAWPVKLGQHIGPHAVRSPQAMDEQQGGCCHFGALSFMRTVVTCDNYGRFQETGSDLSPCWKLDVNRIGSPASSRRPSWRASSPSIDFI